MARLALETTADIPFVLDMVDVDTVKWQQLSVGARWPLRWIYAREGRVMREFERRAVSCASATLVVNECERQALQGIAATGAIKVVPNGLDVSAFGTTRTSRRETRAVSFCGVFDYPPNEEAALWLLRDIWPPFVTVLQTPDCFW